MYTAFGVRAACVQARGWLLVDIVASLPLSYLGMVMHVIYDSGGGGQQKPESIRIAKSLRIVRLGKMLRCAMPLLSSCM